MGRKGRGGGCMTERKGEEEGGGGGHITVDTWKWEEGRSHCTIIT